MGERMESEIREQPAALARLLASGDALGPFVRRLRARPPAGVLLAARGSSDHAAQYGRYLVESETGVPCALAAPSLVTILRRPARLRGWLVVGISQSGQAPDVLAVLESARRRGATCLAVTNDERSPLAAAAHHCLALQAGEEQAVAATKTYTASLAALALLTARWSRDAGLQRALERLPARLERAMPRARELGAALAARLARVSEIAVLGRGMENPSAHELALKLKECALVHAHAYSTADFMHGPAALARPGFRVLAFAAAGPYANGDRRALASLRRRGADVSVLAAPAVDWRLSPLLSILPAQWLALELARRRKLDPDFPGGLKKVTRTW